MPSSIRNILGAALFYTCFAMFASLAAAVIGGSVGMLAIYAMESMR